MKRINLSPCFTHDTKWMRVLLLSLSLDLCERIIRCTVPKAKQVVGIHQMQLRMASIDVISISPTLNEGVPPWGFLHNTPKECSRVKTALLFANTRTEEHSFRRSNG